MARTFDIRFGRSAGLAALLEAPNNSFRWTGAGSLSIDAHGISIAVKRGLLSLLTRNRTRRIPSANLKQVFREGDALRVEFATEESARAWLRFWAHDRETAAQIVQLLPTLSTVELEESAGGGRFRVNRRAITLLVAVLAVTTVGVFAIRQVRVGDPASEIQAMARTSSVSGPRERAVGQVAVVPQASTPAADVPDEVAMAPFERLADSQSIAPQSIVPIVPGMDSYDAARRQLRSFLDESDRGTWWGMTARIQQSVDFHDPALWPLREAELAAASAWLNYFQFYRGSGLAEEAAAREFARRLTNRVFQYVD